MPILQIRVKPGARVSELVASADGSWVARLKSLPVDGKANQELIELVARHFSYSKSSVRIKSGAAARIKWVEVPAD